jgi:hypothetical protein
VLRPLGRLVTDWKPAAAPPRGEPLAALAAVWTGIVGERVAENAAPLEVNGTTLIVATRSSAWSNQLQLLSPQILAGLRALPEGRALERLTFRVGAVRARRGSSEARTRPRTPALPVELEPARDVGEAFERVRRRVTSLRANAGAACTACGAPLETGTGETQCAPCRGGIQDARRLALQQILFGAPWLAFDELQQHVAGLERFEYEEGRRQLLQRWWAILQRALRNGRLSPNGHERQVASSYVLLQSGLPPDRVTGAVVRNLLGEDLDKLLWGAER